MNLDYYREKVYVEYGKEFKALCDYLLEYNKSVNLTAFTQEKDVFLKHFLDSVVGEKFLDLNSNVVEIGSGGGFPSLPIKIIRKDLKFTLIESTGKKCNYLDNCVDKLGLDGVKVLNMRAEDAGRNNLFREKFDCAVARAVAKMNTLCEYCLPLVKVGGKFIAYKGECGEELAESRKAVELLGGEIEKEEKFDLYEEGKRCIIVIRKISPTPLKYPRGQGKERKCPIK